MAKVLINALSAQLGGGQTHILNIFKNYDNVWTDYELFFLTSESNSQIFENEFGKERVVNIGKKGNNFFSRALWENFHLSRIAKKMKVDVVFLAAGIAPFWMTKKCKWVTISHNLLPYSWQSIFQSQGLGLKLKLVIIRYVQIWSFQNTDGVVFTSIHARNLISKFLRKEVVDTVIPSGINSMFFQIHAKDSSEPYFLYVSTFFEYKHQKEVLRAFKKYHELGNRSIKLIFVGNDKGIYADGCKQLCKELGLNDLVIFKGNVPYSHLPSLMQNSLVNIFASDCENCPNILLEYLASGSPIACSSYDPMPEFGKNFVTYFNPMNPNELAELLILKSDKRIPLSQEELSEIKEMYSWEGAARQVEVFFDKLLG